MTMTMTVVVEPTPHVPVPVSLHLSPHCLPDEAGWRCVREGRLLQTSHLYDYKTACTHGRSWAAWTLLPLARRLW